MSHPVTCAKNSSQHPGQIILDSKQKQRTPEQMQANNAQVEQQRKDQIAAREQGLKRVAKIIKQEQEAENLLTNPPKPRPHIPVKPPNPEDGSGTCQDLNGLPGDDSKSGENQQEVEETPTSTQSQLKRQRMQKTFARNAVKTAQGNSHHETETVVADSQGQCDSKGPEKQKWSFPK